MPITQRQARQEISKLIEKYQAMPKPNRQTITAAGLNANWRSRAAQGS